MTVKHEADHFWRAEARIGFMERPDVPAILAECKRRGADIDLDDVTYYIGAETIVPAGDGKGLPRWQEALFAVMGRNAARLSDYSRCPTTRWSRSAARSKFNALANRRPRRRPKRVALAAFKRTV